MKKLIIAELNALTPGVREYVIDFMVKNPAAELCIFCSTAGLTYKQAEDSLKLMKVPYDALMVNQSPPTKVVTPIAFKTIMLNAINDHYDIVLAVDFEAEAVDMYESVGAKLVYNPLREERTHGV